MKLDFQKYLSGMQGRRAIALFLILISLFLQLSAQVKQGELSEAYPRVEPLENILPSRKMLNSGDYTSSVGGLAFMQVAKASKDFTVNALSITYNPQLPDGERLIVSINDAELKIPLPDWQLVPIARFADSEHFGCITLNGKLVDGDEEKKVKENGGYVLNYHSAFFNTLIGWYLMQTDLLIRNPYAVRTPELSGFDPRHYGINNTNNTAKLKAFSKVEEMLNSIQLSGAGKMRSWIISDAYNDITFTTTGDYLALNGGISYYCWRYHGDDPSMDKESNENRMIGMQSVIQNEIDTELWLFNEGVIPENAYRDKLISRNLQTLPEMVELNYKLAMLNIPESRLIQFQKAISNNTLSALLEQSTTQQLVDYWSVSCLVNNLYRIIELKEYNSKLNEEQEFVRAVNPDAWDVSLTTARYSAFFRYIRTSFPSEWDDFISIINSLESEKLVQTPTVLYNTND